MPSEYDIDPNDIQLLDRPGWDTPFAIYPMGPHLLTAEEVGLDPEATKARIADKIRAASRVPLPTRLNPETGRMEEIDPAEARALRVPLGEPVSGGGGPRQVGGGLEMPGGKMPDYYFGGPTLLTSNRPAATQMAKDVKDKGDEKALAREAMESFERHIQSGLQAEAEKRYPEAEAQALPPGQRPTLYNPATGEFEEASPAISAKYAIPLGPPRTTGEHAPEGGVIFSSEPWKNFGASNEPGVPSWYTPPTQEESDRLIRAEQLDKEPEIRRAEPTTPDQLDIDPKDIKILSRAGAQPEKPPVSGYQTPYGAEQEKMLSGLHQEAQPYARQVLDEANKAFQGTGIEARLKEGYRSPQEQDEIYAQGRTKPGEIITNARGGQSKHQSGRAMDIGLYKDGQYIADPQDPAYRKLGPIAKKFGMTWGGDFKSIYDPEHLEVPVGAPKLITEARKAEAAQRPVYTQGPKPPGMLEEGNLDINNRPVVHNKDGSYSTEYSFSRQFDGKEVLIPHVVNGKMLSDEEAIAHFKKTGENLGKFDSPEAADAYAKTLHQRGYTEEQKKEEDARNQVPLPGSRQAMATANRQKLIDAIAATEKQGYPVPHGIGTPNEPEGDRGPTKDMENLVGAMHKAEIDALRAGDKKKADGIAQARSYWEDQIKTSGMTQEQEDKANAAAAPQEPDIDPNDIKILPKDQAYDIDPADIKITSRPQPVAKVTAYRPGGGPHLGLNSSIEGGIMDAHETPILGRTTMEDYQAGHGDYVTVAMDKNSAWQDQFLTSPNYPGVVFRVRDNGAYGNGKTQENWVDIAYTDPEKAKHMLLRDVPFTPIPPEVAQEISASRANLLRTPDLLGAPDQPAALRDITPPAPPQETTSAFGRMAGIQKPYAPAPPADRESATGEREPGFWESAGQGAAAAAIGTAEVLNDLGKRYGIKTGEGPEMHPDMGGVFGKRSRVSDIIKELYANPPPEAEVKLNQAAEDLSKFRKGFEADPEKTTQSLLATWGRGTGTLAVDVVTSLAMPGATVAKGTSLAIKALKGGYSFTLPAIRDANHAYDAAINAGKTPGQATLAWWEAFGKTILVTSLPLHATSSAPNLATRLVERGGKGAAVGVGVNVGLTGAENLEDYLKGEKPRGFNWKEIAASGINLGVLSAGMGGRGAPRAEGPVAPPKGGGSKEPAPTGEERFAPPEAPAKAPSSVADALSAIPPKEAPTKPSAKPAGIVGKKVGEVAPEPENLKDRRGYVQKRKTEGATVDQAAEELKAEDNAHQAALDAALPVGSVIRSEGGLYQLEKDGTWRPIGEGAERGKGVKQRAEDGDEIVRVGDGQTHDSLDWKPAAPKVIPPRKAPTGEERFAPGAPKGEPYQPLPEPEGTGVGFVASPHTVEALSEISETAPTLLKQLRSLPTVTDWMRAVKNRMARKMVDAQAVMKMRKEVDAQWKKLEFGAIDKTIQTASGTETIKVKGRRLTPYQIKIRAQGVTNYIQAGGDRAELARRAAASKNAELRKGYEAAANLTPEEVEIARKIDQTFNDYLHRLRAVGIDVTEHKNYVNGRWQAKIAEAAGVPMPRKMSDYFQFKKQKFFDNYFEGEQQGYVPKTKDIRELLAFYMQTADKAINDRLFAQDLQSGKASDGTPLLQSTGRISVLPRDIEKLKAKSQETLNKWREGKLRRFGDKNLDRYGTASMKVEDKSRAIQSHASDLLDEKLSILREQRATDLEESGEKTLAEFGARIDKAVDPKEKNRIGAEGTKVGRERSRAINDYHDALETAATREHDLNVKNADTLAAQGEDFLRKHAAAQSKTFQDLVEETYAKRQKQIARMKGNSFLIDSAFVPKGEGGARYVNMNYPALQNWKRMAWAKGGDPIYTKVDLAVHPEIASHLNNLFGQSGFHKHWNEPTDNVFGQYFRGVTKFVFNDFQQYFKQTLFGGGPLAPFHQIHQGYQFATGHRMNPLTNLERIDLENNPKQMQWARDGLMLAPDRVGQHYFMEGMGGGEKNLITIMLRKLGEVDGMGVSGKAADQIERYTDWLFTQYIPSLSLKSADATLERNRWRFRKELAAGTVTDEQVRQHTAEQINATSGLMNKDMQKWGSNPTLQHLVSMVAIAPHFGEGRVRHFGQAAYSLVKYNKGAEQLEGIAIGALAMWAAARIINYMGDGDFHFDHPFEAHIGNRWITMRSQPSDILRAAPQSLTEAMGLGDQGPGFGQFVLNRVAPIPRLAIDIAKGTNWRGDKAGDWTLIMDMLYGMTPVSLQGLTKPLTSTGRSDPLSALDHAINATGFPVHQYSPITEMNRKAHAWTKDYHPEKEETGTFGPSPYKPLQNALEDMDKNRVLEEIQALKTERKMTMEEIRKGFNERMGRAFTYSHEGDKFFRTSLSTADKIKFDASVKYKQEILRKFMLWAPTR